MKSKLNLKRVIPILAGVCVVICAAILVFTNIGLAGYYVTVEKTPHGTITADRKRAEEGDVVTLTSTADEGYELKEISVNGEVLDEMSFKMPKENVLIEGKFSVLNKTTGKTEAYDGEALGAISYHAIYPSGEAHLASWNLIYEEDALVATAWIEGAIDNGNGVLLNLAKEELSETPDVSQVFCEYQKKDDITSAKISIKELDKEGVMQETSKEGVVASVIDWEEDGKTVGYQATIKIKYGVLGYSNKQSAKASLVALVGNRARVLPNTIAEFWLDGEYDPENYLSYPRLLDDNTLQKNKFIDMTEMELESYRDIGVILDGEISEGEYVGTIIEDATENHRLWAQGHLTRGGNVRLALIIESNTAFDQLVNAYPGVGQYLFAEIGLGNNDGQTCTLIKANVQGEVENAISAVKIVEDKDSNYKHKAIMELWIPKASISDNISSNFVRLSRLALFSGNQGKNSKPDNIFLVARWADINNCSLTTGGIQLENAVVPPSDEIKGMDGVLSEGEYKGVVLEQKTKTHRMTARGYLTKGKNIRFALEIDANTEPSQIINDFPTLGKYLFVEAAFGHNSGEKNCTFVKANVLGQAAYATAVAKTTDNGKNAKYRYTTIIEMWIPSSAITNNKTPDNVPITRLALFAGNVEGNKTPDNLFLVAKWVEMNNCSITADGICWPGTESAPEEEKKVIVPKNEAGGFDGVISEGEYKGATLVASTDNHKISVKGYVTKGKNVRLALTIDAKTAPKKVVNSYPELSQYLFAEIGLGNNDGQACKLIKANVLGDAEHAAAIAKTKDNGKKAKYRYTTVVEMWIPKASITNNTDANNVEITRIALFSGNLGENSTPDNIFLVAKWAQINESTVTADGIKLKGQSETPESVPEITVPKSESKGFDGVISAGEYKGATLKASTDKHKLSVQGYITKGKNVRLALTIDAKTAPKEVVNSYPNLSQYLFAEIGLGNNDGQTCTLIKANVLGDAEHAAAIAKTKDNGRNAEYRYTTVVEVWIPKASITNNTDANNVEITRIALFSGNLGEHVTPDNIFLVAKWAQINESTVTAEGIKLKGQSGAPGEEPESVPKVTVPKSESDGFDGVISAGEYKGATLKASTDKHKISVQGHITKGKNVRLALIIDAKTAPKEVLNSYPGLSQYLFAEIGLGNNDGQTCTLIKANVLGDAEHAAAIAKTKDNGKNAKYRYTTVVEMWIPKASITNNTDANNVEITRVVLFSGNLGENSTPDNIFLVAKWAQINESTVTADGIKLKGQSEEPGDGTEEEIPEVVPEVTVPESESDGFDGVISDGEYKGATLKASTDKHKISVRGYITEGKNVRLALTIDAKTASEEVVNSYPSLSQYLFAEIGLGDNDGQTCTLIKANVLGSAENAAAVAKTKDNGESAEYRYTTVVEVWIPKASITNNTDEDNVEITRVALFSGNLGENSTPDNIFLVAKWAQINESTVTADGIKLKDQLEVPESEANGFDGKISAGEYYGAVIEKASANYKASVRGYLTEGKNIRLGVEIHSKHEPEKVLNNYPELCQYLFTELAFGDNAGNEVTTKLIQANVLGDAKNAVTKVETTDQGNSSEYRYTTVVEMWIPSSAITNNTTPDKVAITRMGLLHDLDAEDPDANWVIAKWANIQECYLTADGIRKVNTLVVPEAEKDGLDGEIKDGEYKGIILDSTKGSSTSIDYKLTVQGYLNEANNIRLGVTIYSSRNPETDVNPIALWRKKLFGEFGFGNNNGETCTKIYADALGDAENAVTVVKTTDLGENVEQRYKTVIEMWIPKEVAGENTTPNMVQFTRAALFHQNYANPENVNETWLVLRSAWNNGGMNNCYVTKEGIVETHLLAGMDGVINADEYPGVIVNSSHTNETNYKVTMQGFMQGTEKYKHSIRLALKIDAKTAPEENVNPATQFSEKLYADLAFGDVDGSGERIMVFADVLGNAKNAVTVVKTTDNGASAQYRYTTVIEMWIPQAAISVESHDDLVWIPRFGLYHQNIQGDPENWVVAKWAYLHNWLRLRTYGLEE